MAKSSGLKNASSITGKPSGNRRPNNPPSKSGGSSKSSSFGSNGGSKKQNFDINGYFYKIEGIKCRKYLNIKRKDAKIKTPNLMVVMMNPGKSKPVDGIDDGKKEVETIPDKTLDQIMRVMEICGFEYSRILNLSDARIPPCGAFYDMLPNLKKNQIPHSIFDKKRDKDFIELFVANIPTIFAWGVSKNLTELAKIATDRIGIKHSIGIKKIDEEFAFYQKSLDNCF